ncbi:MAG: UvrD-helicase domain-containing protein [Solirubrobacteraceae bacterium]
MTERWTEEQRRAIERRDGELLLDAGAGSGKTSVLVERFAQAVIEDGVDIGAILAITFTDKAAAELRDRIRARLRELGADEQARATEGAFISTIHGFCARVLRAGALAAGLDPGFVVLDSDQSEPLAAVAFDDALAELARTDGGAVGLVADYGAGPLRTAVLSVYAQLRSRGRGSPRLPACPPRPGPDSAVELSGAVEALMTELGMVAQPGPKVAEALRRLDRCRTLLATGADPWPAELDPLKLPSNGAALSTDACSAYGAALARYRGDCAARAARPVRDQLDALLAAFGERYAERKRELSGIDFEDLELITRELLLTRDELRERYAQRFERIMVDELQDTNRVQLELIETIADANLFTVGDAQQSIYRFRHADVELFERRGEQLAAVKRRERLQTNFRSRPEILAALNAAFAIALGSSFRPLVAGRPAAGADASVELLLVDKGADWELEGLAAPWRLAEAQALARRIAELVAAGTAPGEIVVLLRATTDMRAYERALERRGLPTYVIGGRGYWLHPQVLDMTSYLRALANPHDEEALYAVLASPLAGATIDALVMLGGVARERGHDPWWVLCFAREELAALPGADREALDRFADWFARERAAVARSGIEELLDRALSETGYDLEMLALPGGRRRLANVRKLMRLARDYERDHGPDVRGFLTAIADRAAGRAAESRESEAPVEGEGLDAIRLMTIHRAKGLEFHTVCVADLGRSMRPAHSILRVDGAGRLGMRLARAGIGGRVSALDYDAIGVAERRAEEAEERRLFYVAMTRAQERLILSGATKFDGWTDGRGTGGGPVAWIAPAFVPELAQRLADGGAEVELEGATVRLSIASVDERPQHLPAQSPAPPTPSPPAPPALEPPVPAPPVTTLSYSSLGEYAHCGYRFYSERVLRLPAVDRMAVAGDVRVARAAVDRGVLIHALLERLDFRRAVAPNQAAVAAAASRARLAPPSPEEVDELAALIGRFAASTLCARLAAATEVRREERFTFLLPDGLLITGAVDVRAREPGGRTLIVDYKSDRLEGADPALAVQRGYETQRLIYALAALRAGAQQVDVAYCFLETPESPVLRTIERSDLQRLERRLTDLAGGVLRREFEVSPEPHRALCEGCPAEGGLCSWPLQVTRRESPDQLF